MNIRGFGNREEKYIDENKSIKKALIAEYSDEINQAFDGITAEEAARELNDYGLEIASVMNDYNRKSTEETMMVKTYRKRNQETTNRKTHQENVANIAVRIAKGINQKSEFNKFNLEVLDIMARNHDIGHTFAGHSGEWWLSNIKEDYGIGYYCHNALGPRELIYTNKIYDKIIEQIRLSDPDIDDAKLDKIRSSLWIIMEGINSHNGERSESEYIPNTKKTEKDFELENLYCHTKKGFDKEIVPATKEAALMRLSDKISSIPYDTVDGIREGFINGLDDEYKDVLGKMGITKEDISRCEEEQDYVPIARKLQTIFIRNVIENSSTDFIKMDPELAKNMHELRSINNKNIVDYVVLEEDHQAFTKTIRHLTSAYKQIIELEGIVPKLEQGVLSREDKENLRKKYENTPYKGFVTYMTNTSQEDFAYTKEIVLEATRQSIEDEQKRARDIILSGEDFKVSDEFEKRDKRIEVYVNYYKEKDLANYTEEQKQEDVNTILNNIQNQNRKSFLYLSMNDRIALEMGTKYLSTLNDIEFMQLMKENHMLTAEQEKSITRGYRDIPTLHEDVHHQSNWTTIKAEQNQEDMDM